MGLAGGYALAGLGQGIQSGIGNFIAEKQLERQNALLQQQASDEHLLRQGQINETSTLAPYRLAAFLRSNGLFPNSPPPVQPNGGDTGAPQAAPVAGATAPAPSQSLFNSPGALGSFLQQRMAGNAQPSPVGGAPSPSPAPSPSIGAIAGQSNSAPPLNTQASSPPTNPPSLPPSASGSVPIGKIAAGLGGGASGQIPIGNSAPIAVTKKGVGVLPSQLTQPTIDYGNGVSAANPMGITYSNLVESGMDPHMAALVASNPELAKKLRTGPDGQLTVVDPGVAEDAQRAGAVSMAQLPAEEQKLVLSGQISLREGLMLAQARGAIEQGLQSNQQAWETSQIAPKAAAETASHIAGIEQTQGGEFGPSLLGMFRSGGHKLGEMLTPTGGPTQAGVTSGAMPSQGGPKIPLADRLQQLKGLGLGKAAAKAQLLEEGYNLGTSQ